MPLARIIVILFLISCTNQERSISDKSFQTYLSTLFLQTTFSNCERNKLQETFSFEDLTNDTKVGFLQVAPKNLDIQDLLGGSFQNSQNQLRMELFFNNVPENINVDFPPLNSSHVDLELSYHFFVPEEITIGIIHYSNGEKKTMLWNQFNIQVFELTQMIGTCGKPIKTDHSLSFICEKSLLPILNKINSNHTFNARVTYREANYTYQDCY